MAVSRRLRFEVLKRDDHTCRYCGASPRNTPDVALTIDHVVPTTLGGGDDPTNLVTACQPCNAGKSSVPANASIVADVASDALRWSRAIASVADTMLRDRVELDKWTEEWWLVWDKWHYEVKVDDPWPERELTGEPLWDHWPEIVGRWHNHCEPTALGSEPVALTVSIVRGYATKVRGCKSDIEAALFQLFGEEIEVGFVVNAKSVRTHPHLHGTSHMEKRTLPVDPNWRQSLERFIATGFPRVEIVRLVDVSMNGPASRDEKWRYFCGCCWSAITDMQEAARLSIEEASNAKD